MFEYVVSVLSCVRQARRWRRRGFPGGPSCCWSSFLFWFCAAASVAYSSSAGGAAGRGVRACIRVCLLALTVTVCLAFCSKAFSLSYSSANLLLARTYSNIYSNIVVDKNERRQGNNPEAELRESGFRPQEPGYVLPNESHRMLTSTIKYSLSYTAYLVVLNNQ